MGRVGLINREEDREKKAEASIKLLLVEIGFFVVVVEKMVEIGLNAQKILNTQLE